MSWEKRGVIFSDSKRVQTPIPQRLNFQGLYRIYYARRDDNSHSQIEFIEINIKEPLKILSKSSPDRSIIPTGDLGTFDYAGVMPSCIIYPTPKKNPNEVWMYYTGWSQRLDVPYHNSIGLAVSKNRGETFKKYSAGPLFSSTTLEPYFTGTPHIIKENNLWRCWYYSCVGWIKVGDKVEPRYNIKYAESYDGINWIRNAKVAVDFKSTLEGGICSPSIILDGGIYKMWFSYRGLTGYRADINKSYKIGYAESADGFDWERMDNMAGIDPSETGWDSEMICYSSIIEHEKEKYMLYNGNNFGETGIGIAKLVNRI